ncbi:helix-turn-helix transcriptional regulator [Asticcacaulis benevestitus]|uniref:HTH luxR-type domain-containing protein n=1 Tax=Asticcacaulis benevestitus DSM 16100 = ATCC BAA-896 TaxID=1121022 RepID=V4PY32_9CAUL|nr:helix-turn-helix transcriptional regulator [Asticcacaulis benevestitus]ESQ90485.1 hypothetical protein ABENE_12240 [Asticcacaulis benevestitus DSM 16100 = ATCC BAA-896]
MTFDNAMISQAEFDEVLELIEAIYDTVADPGLWPQLLERISMHIGTGCVGLSLVDTRTYEIRVAAHWGAQPEFLQAMMQSVSINPATTAHWYIDVDEPFTVESLLGRDRYHNSRFYRTINAPNNCVDGLISILNRSGDRYGNIALPRFTEHGPITKIDLLRLKRLSPHIRRAVTLTDMLDSQSLSKSLLNQTFDLLSTAIILVDKGGYILHANQAAETMMNKASVIWRKGGNLHACDDQGEKHLKTALGQLDAVPRMMPRPPAASVALSSHSADDVTAWVLPLDSELGRLRRGARAATAAILIREAVESQLPGSLLMKRFDLTPAQVRVLSLLSQGQPASDVADILGISIHTVRSHMQQIFAKTCSKGLPELLHLCRRHLAPILA